MRNRTAKSYKSLLRLSILNNRHVEVMELVQTFNNTLNDFIGNIKRCYPNDTKDLVCIEMMQDTRPLQKFMKSIGDNMEKITGKDSSLFDTPLECVGNCDISKIYSLCDRDENRDAIWKYLQTLSLIGSTIRSKSSNLEEFFEQFTDNFDPKANNNIHEQMMNMVQDLLNSGDGDDDDGPDIEEINDDGESVPKTPEDAAEAYNEMFKDTKIGNLAQEIAEDIDMSAFEDITKMDSPDISSIMEKLVGGGGVKNLIQNVAAKLKAKMDSGDVNQEELIGEVHEMMAKMKKDKKFKKMFKSKDVQGIMKEFMKQKGQEVNDDDDFSVLEEMCGPALKKASQGGGLPNIPPGMRGGARRNGARNRLRRKLEAKRNALPDEQD
tara:strand:+ start:8528 stop:9667 length:1140 start_codon:yes stop_codon:yes gene_type:complete